MTKKKIDPQERTENRRNQVLEAAEICFLKNGFHGASMAEISKTANMSVGHIYNYFESKEAIICDLIAQDVSAVMEMFRQAIKDRVPVADIMRMYAEREVRCNYRNHKREFAALMHDIMAEVGRNPKITEVMWKFDQTLRELLSALCRLQQPDWPEEKLKARAEILMALLHSYKFRSAVNPDMDKDVYLDELTQLIRKFFEE